MRIEAKNLVKIYGDRCVVNDNSFYIDKGEVVCLLGPNGAGKTTTFYMIVGLVKPNSGQIFIDGTEISNWPMNLRAKAGTTRKFYIQKINCKRKYSTCSRNERQINS